MVFRFSRALASKMLTPVAFLALAGGLAGLASPSRFVVTLPRGVTDIFAQLVFKRYVLITCRKFYDREVYTLDRFSHFPEAQN